MNANPRFIPVLQRSTSYHYAIGYLRAVITLLVIAHHAALAYHPFAPPPPASLVAQPRFWQAFPVVDPGKWSGSALLVGFDDIFFMSLMFFISGLFVWRGLRVKGPVTFLRDRIIRLGIPFILSIALLAPLAYYPTYLQTTPVAHFAEFRDQWLSLGNFPAGPAWFIGLLLAFDCIAAFLAAIAPRWGETLGRLTSGRGPLTFFGFLLAISAIAYIPMALKFTPMAWSSFGPFTVQTSRFFLYLVYFLIAVGVGAYGSQSGLLAADGKLARRWIGWVMTALLLFGAAIGATIAKASPLILDTSFVLSCAATGFAFLAVFVRFAQSRSKLFDSVSENAYGIFLLHYVFVSSLQYALLPASLPGVAKAAIVFSGAFLASWGTTATLRRVPFVARII